MCFEIHEIGIVHSSLKTLDECPCQESEGAPSAWIEIAPEYVEGIEGLQVGDEILILSWLHLGDRTRLKVHPKGDRTRPLQGVFSTRSPSRPNPIGLHQCRIVVKDGLARFQVEPLEVLDGTAIVDIKPVL